jgi:uncharacterized membrane-anchored protein YjiN (DUF445 family)
MKAAATGLLVLMAGLYLTASLVMAHWPAASGAAAYGRAFAEAAMVGACADWFAVTALFRRPLGLPIPHTAVIPRNKHRIGEALGRFIVDNFLSPRVLDAKLRQLELAAWGGDWLQREENAAMIAHALVKAAPEVIRALPPGALEDLLGAAALAAAKAVPAAPAASAILAAVWDEDRAHPLVEQSARLLADYLSEHQEVILQNVQAQSWRWLPGWVDRAIANRITGGVLQLLADVQSADHPWRVKLGEGVNQLIVRLAADPDLAAQGEALKRQVLDDPRLHEHVHRVWREIEHQLQSQWTGGSDELERKIVGFVRDLGRWLRDDPVVQRTLNTGARALARRLLAPRRQAIGQFVAGVVQGWDARSVVDRLELQVGPDLQFIRVNGTLVGGIVGVAIFALSRLLHLP